MKMTTFLISIPLDLKSSSAGAAERRHESHAAYVRRALRAQLQADAVEYHEKNGYLPGTHGDRA